MNLTLCTAGVLDVVAEPNARLRCCDLARLPVCDIERPREDEVTSSDAKADVLLACANAPPEPALTLWTGLSRRAKGSLEPVSPM